MAPAPASVLAINGGSSSIKFAVYRAGTVPTLSLSGTLDRIGRSGTTLSWGAKEGAPIEGYTEVPDDTPAASPDRLAGSAGGVRRRQRRGTPRGPWMAHSEPERVTPDLLDELRRATPYAPDHLPREIELIEAFRERHPHLPQVACFDTAFHGMMPRVATLLPIPRRYQAKGVQRDGFHGLSYAYLVEELAHPGFIDHVVNKKADVIRVYCRPTRTRCSRSRTTACAAATASKFDVLFTTDKPIITTTPFDMVVLNDLDRFHLVADVIDRVPALGPRAACTQQAIRDKRIEHRQHIAWYGEDMPEIRNWRWSLRTAAPSARGRSSGARGKRS